MDVLKQSMLVSLLSAQMEVQIEVLLGYRYLSMMPLILGSTKGSMNVNLANN